MYPDPKSLPVSSPEKKRDVAQLPEGPEKDIPLPPFPATSDVLCVFAFLWSPPKEDQ